MTTTLLPRVSTIKVNDIDLGQLPTANYVEDENGRILMNGLHAANRIPWAPGYQGSRQLLGPLVDELKLRRDLPENFLDDQAPILTHKNSIGQTKRLRFLSVAAIRATFETHSTKFLMEALAEIEAVMLHHQREADERNAPPPGRPSAEERGSSGTVLILHPTNGIEVPQRRRDGYVFITNLLRAASLETGIEKAWSNYRQTTTTEAFISELEGSLGITRDLLIESQTKGPNHLRGTWVHPQVAVNVGQWASPKFAVMVSEWVVSWMLEGKEPAKPVTGREMAHMYLAELDRREKAEQLAEERGEKIGEHERNWENFSADAESMPPQQMAKTYGLCPRKVAAQVKKMCYKNKDIPLQDHIDTGRLEYKFFDRETKTYVDKRGPGATRPQIFVTTKGIKYIAEKLSETVD